MVIVQLAIVFGISFFINRLSVGAATALFLMFGALAVWGAVTDVDLSRVGSIAFMALIGLILATIVNIFWANSTL